ncbi:MAG: MerR family transcriptional regulator [Oscillospiraceae bacterium]
MFRIGEFSKISKTTIKTLRYYDEEGLLKPAQVDKFTGYRLYTTNQLVEVHKIHSLRQIGLSIAEIKLILSEMVSLNDILRKHKAEVIAELRNSNDQLSRIEFILSGEDNFMNYQAIIKQLPECNVYSTKKVIKNYDEYFQLIPAIGKKVTSKYPNLKCATPEYCFVNYLDGEYREKDISIEFCEAIEKLEGDFDDIVFKKIPSVTAVSVMHKGPYNTLSNAYSFIMKWIEDNGYSMTDYPRESYIDGIWNKENDEDWLTEIQVPVKK